MFTKEEIQTVVRKKEKTKIGKQRAYLAKGKESLIQLTKQYKEENGIPLKVSQLREIVSNELVEGGIEKEAYVIKPSYLLDKKTGEKKKVDFKEYVASKALILELFKGHEDLIHQTKSIKKVKSKLLPERCIEHADNANAQNAQNAPKLNEAAEASKRKNMTTEEKIYAALREK